MLTTSCALMENSKAFRIDRYTELIIVVPPGEPVIKAVPVTYQLFTFTLVSDHRFLSSAESIWQRLTASTALNNHFLQPQFVLQQGSGPASSVVMGLYDNFTCNLNMVIPEFQKCYIDPEHVFLPGHIIILHFPVEDVRFTPHVVYTHIPQRPLFGWGIHHVPTSMSFHTFLTFFHGTWLHLFVSVPCECPNINLEYEKHTETLRNFKRISKTS